MVDSHYLSQQDASGVLARAGTKYATHRQIKSPSQEGDLGGGNTRVQKRKTFRSSFFVPPQVVPEVAQSAYNRDFRPLHVSWCVKNVLVRTPREIRGFPGTNIVFFSAI